jgi:hypothetical protein
LAHQHVHDITEVDPAFAAIDYLAQDVGIDVGEADHALRILLQKYRAKAADAGMWAVLPEMYGVSFVSAKWRTAGYSVAQEGFLNNSHCMAEALRCMIVSFNRMAPKQEAQEVPARITADMERLIKCSAYSILHMTARAQEGYNVAWCMIFLEQFILGTGGRLQLALLEDCFPYTLLRTNFIQIYQRQTATGGMIEEEKDEKKPEEKKADGQQPPNSPAANTTPSQNSSPAPVTPASPRNKPVQPIATTTTAGAETAPPPPPS